MTNPRSAERDRRTRRREGRRLGRRESGHQPRPVEIVRPPSAERREAVAVAQAWSDAVSAGDVDAAIAWYAPEAVLHHEGRVVFDHESIRRCWTGSPVLGLSPTTVSVSSDDSTSSEGFDAEVRWVGLGVDGADVESRLRVHQGYILEQWHGEVRRFEPVVGPPLEMSTAGRFTQADRDQVTAMMWRVLDRVEPDVRHAGLRLEHHADPARPARFSARAWVQLDHHQVHVRASEATIGALVDTVEHRLRLQLETRADRVRATRRRGTASPEGEWRHGDRPPPHPQTPARSDEEREVIVRTTWAGGPETVDEAVDDLDALDLEVLLFQELSTGQPAVVWFEPDQDRYRIRLAGGGEVRSDEVLPTVAEVVTDPHPFPSMDVESARTALLMGEPWVVFRDEHTGEAGVLYRRIDGHDGLVMLDHRPVD